ncbi:hypothetical protein LCGC14_1534710 [marine sediment metagenome]|uniref:Uncharacterized protein n=1 Tax=marine sediment metagenome TaxID=412755 RepID=A0A0F9LAL4_9ZZZZ
MTKKERTIKACRELAAKYREPEGKGLFFRRDSCPLCLIHDPNYSAGCVGCPLADKGGDTGCIDFRTYKRANRCRTSYSYNARAAFFDKIIPILEGIPASRFTKRGWKYFDELDRSW